MDERRTPETHEQGRQLFLDIMEFSNALGHEPYIELTGIVDDIKIVVDINITSERIRR